MRGRDRDNASKGRLNWRPPNEQRAALVFGVDCYSAPILAAFSRPVMVHRWLSITELVLVAVALVGFVAAIYLLIPAPLPA